DPFLHDLPLLLRRPLHSRFPAHVAAFEVGGPASYRNYLSSFRGVHYITEAAETLREEDTLTSNILRMHIFGELKDRAKAEKAFNLVEHNHLPIVISLRDELTARYGIRKLKLPLQSEEWVFDKECELLLMAA
ncbi:MAG: hypothetical protein HY234_00130, partial [Acidobacteria bacterium]|nr:hypothetical protein [Acidobacteriota bacterium]